MFITINFAMSLITWSDRIFFLGCKRLYFSLSISWDSLKVSLPSGFLLVIRFFFNLFPDNFTTYFGTSFTDIRSFRSWNQEPDFVFALFTKWTVKRTSLFTNNLITHFYALVTNKYWWTSYEFCNFVLTLSTKWALEKFRFIRFLDLFHPSILLSRGMCRCVS